MGSRMNILTEFQSMFWTGFKAPELKSDRVRDLLVDLEIVSDALAGPLYTIYKDGNCDYVFRDREGRFPGVSDANTFRSWALGVAERYRRAVLAFAPVDNTETADQAVLLDQADRMRELADLAWRVQTEREQERRGRPHQLRNRRGCRTTR